jgi:hypothetical protein
MLIRWHVPDLPNALRHGLCSTEVNWIGNASLVQLQEPTVSGPAAP